MAMVIDGKALAKKVRAELKQRVDTLNARGITPGLAVVLVGDDPASAIYVRNKTKACQKLGITHFDHLLPASIAQDELLGLIQKLNDDPVVDGILVQLPLPDPLDAGAVIRALSPAKDADGLHPASLGGLITGQPSFVACTPLGVMRMLKEAATPFVGAHAVVVGRSTLVGKPMALLLLQEHCTVTMCHSRTKDLDRVVAGADIVVAAVGQPELIRGAWIKEGATVIDVGMNRRDERLLGDVEFAAAGERARAISPVPGGVGPMTITMLLSNTVDAATRRAV